MPASTNPTRPPAEGSSATAPTTIAHPATSNKRPASFILFYLEELQRLRLSSTSTRLHLAQPLTLMRQRRSVQLNFFIVPRKGKGQTKPAFLIGWRDAWTHEKPAQSPRRAPQRNALPSGDRRVPRSVRRLVLPVGALSHFRDEPRPRFCRRGTVARRLWIGGQRPPLGVRQTAWRLRCPFLPAGTDRSPSKVWPDPHAPHSDRRSAHCRWGRSHLGQLKSTAQDRVVSRRDLAGIQSHPDNGVHPQRVEDVDFSLSCNATSGHQPPRGGLPDCPDRLHRDSSHQPLGIDMRVKKSFAERFERANHVERGKGSFFAP